MLNQIGQLAEEAAVNVSRRQAMTRVGKGALACVAWLAGMAANRTEAALAHCCRYNCGGTFRQYKVHGKCPNLNGCTFLGDGGC